jgi:FkbM family methyltransferase
MMSGTFEPAETVIVRKLVGNIDVFVDVGANIGYYVCHALQSNPECRVVAIEPLPSNLRCLLRNVKANGWDHRCEIMPIAVSSEPAVVSLFGAGTGASLVRGWNGAPDSSALLVPANTLSNILGDRFANQRCLIMIDVEGHESAVIAGAQALLARVPKPVWFVEIGLGEHIGGRAGNPAFRSVFDEFFAAGYDAWACTSTPRRLSVEEIDSAARGSTSLGTHNFLFVDKGVDVSAMKATRGQDDAHRSAVPPSFN